jgi:nucleoside-diphosphate-sugar epimerase
MAVRNRHWTWGDPCGHSECVGQARSRNRIGRIIDIFPEGDTMRVFVTGATGWIGSGVVPELIAAGHEVTGLARSDTSAVTLAAAGAKVHRGDLDNLGSLRSAAAASDGVIHVAFRTDLSLSGNREAAAAVDRLALEAFGDALAGSGRPLVIASGTIGLAPGRMATERDGHDLHSPDAPMIGGAAMRLANAEMTLGLSARGVRSSVVRLAPSVHGDGDHGFMATLVRIAREKGISGYIGDGTNRWPAVHRSDAARLFRLALETAPAGSTLHAVADEGVQLRAVAEVIGRHLDIPERAFTPEEAQEHFSFLAGLLALDSPASSALTREQTGWQPTHPGLIEDLDQGHYYRDPSRCGGATAV